MLNCLCNGGSQVSALGPGGCTFDDEEDSFEANVMNEA